MQQGIFNGMGKHVRHATEPIDPNATVQLGHGAGGRMTSELIDLLLEGVMYKNLEGGIGTIELDDGGAIPVPGSNSLVVITSDGHTVDPLVFPGGNLGKLSACGTINDVLMLGAKPVAMTHVMILEEGIPFKLVQMINESFVSVLNQQEVALIAGDTKVMPHGTVSGCISATTGIGIVKETEIILDSGVQPGDEIVVSGTLGDHEIALLASREGLGFETELVSDVEVLDKVAGAGLEEGAHAMKDPTRGGLATTLNEFAQKSQVSIWIEESSIPFKDTTVNACEMLGLNPFELASEGRAVIAVPKGHGEALVRKINQIHPNAGAAMIGKAKSDHAGKVLLKTSIGGTRVVRTPIGEPIPRVC